MEPTTSTVHEKTFYFVIQRAQQTPDDNPVWVDSSGKYWGTEGDDTAQAGVLAERDRLRQIFGTHLVRVVRRDVLVIETPVE